MTGAVRREGASVPSPRSVRLASWIVAGMAVAVFLNTLGHDFAYDDTHIIQQNTSIHSLESLPASMLRPYWPNDMGRALGLWRPVSTAIYGLEWSLWDGRPQPFHALSVLLHALASVLVFRLLLRILPFAGALAGGMLFAVHAVHVEAVANIVGRAEVLSTVFYLGACLLFVRWRERLGGARVAALCALYALAFLTKESAVTLPGVLLLLDGFLEEVRLRDLPAYLVSRWRVYGGLALTAALVLLGRYAVLGSVARPLAPFGADILEEIPRIWTVAGAWPHYVRLLVFPYDLSVDYAPAVLRILYGWTAANTIGAVLVLGILALALWSWRAPPSRPDTPRPRVVGFGVVWFVITISTVANVLFLSGVLLAERTFYLPSVGFAAVFGWIVSYLHVRRPRIAAILVATVVVLMSVRTVTRNPVWKDTLTVFNGLLDEHPESARVQWALGDVFFERGAISEALRAYRLSIGIGGAHYSLLREIGVRLVSVGRFESARPVLEFAWRDHPEYASAPQLLAVTYSALGEWDKAEEAARATLEIDRGDPSMLHILASALGHQERWSEAADARREAIRGGEGSPWQQWSWLATEEARAGRQGAARAALDSARARGPDPAVVTRLDSLGVELGLN